MKNVKKTVPVLVVRNTVKVRDGCMKCLDAQTRVNLEKTVTVSSNIGKCYVINTTRKKRLLMIDDAEYVVQK